MHTCTGTYVRLYHFAVSELMHRLTGLVPLYSAQTHSRCSQNMGVVLGQLLNAPQRTHWPMYFDPRNRTLRIR